MPITLGILAQSRQAAVVGDFVLLETQVLGSAQASVVFSGLGTYSTTYKHFQIRYAARSNLTADSQSWIRMSVNGTAADRWHDLRGNGSTVTSNAGQVPYIGLIPSANQASNIFGSGVIDLLDAFATKNKTTRALHGFAGNLSSFVILNSNLRLDTSATSSISFTCDLSELFVTNTRFSLYGVK